MRTLSTAKADRAWWAGLLLSALLHAAAGSALLSLGRVERVAPLEVTVVTGGAGPADGRPAGRASGRAFRPVRPGGEQPDLLGPPGPLGGSGEAAEVTVHLAAQAHPVLLQEAEATSPLAQLQRIRTAALARSPIPRRATPNPALDRFLASGRGPLRARAPRGELLARAGRRASRPSQAAATPMTEHGDAVASEAAAGPRAERLPAHEPTPPPSASREGLEVLPAVGRSARRPGARAAPRPGTPLGEAQGAETPRTAVATGRPPLPRGLASTLAAPGPRPADRTDAMRLASPRAAGSLADASGAPAPRKGRGVGGRALGGARAGPGGRAHGPGRARRGLGPGRGEAEWRDARYWRWYLEQRRRVERALRFPKARALALDQGTALLKLTVRRDGTLAGPPRLLRSSGFADLDAEAISAVKRTLPFAPLPPSLAPGRATVPVLLSVEFSNPVVR